MNFERLRLTGFKSFCDSAEFRIEPGLTGVVGPNGCGKSNLVEALRWVMGENSFKNMRASGMEDVIFSGSGRRPSRNNAEVGLALDNADRRAPAAFNDFETIEVTRRIERDTGLDLPGQRQGGARARRPAPVRRRFDRRALALPGAPGPDRRDHFRQAPGAPADPGRGRGRLRPPLAPARSRASAEGRGGQSRPRRGRSQADRRPGRQPQAPGAPVEPLPRAAGESAARRRWPPHRLARA